MPKAAQPTTGRRWHSPSCTACARSSPTATSAWAKLYRRTGKPEHARENLTAATTMYREMDMGFWLEQGLR